MCGISNYRVGEMEGTYEYELERAELLGVEPPNREKWEEQNKARLEAEVEEEQTEVARELEGVEEKLKETHGKMDELNSILSATQLKINKFKVVLPFTLCSKKNSKYVNKFFRLFVVVLQVC